MITINKNNNTNTNNTVTEQDFLAKLLSTTNLEQKETKLDPGVYTLIFDKVEVKASVKKDGSPKAWLVVKGHLEDGRPVSVRNLWIHTEGGACMSFGTLSEQGMPLVYNPNSSYGDYIQQLNTYKGTLKLGVLEDTYSTVDVNGNPMAVTKLDYTLDLGKIKKIEQALKEPKKTLKQHMEEIRAAQNYEDIVIDTDADF